jgi:hypothetical protein
MDDRRGNCQHAAMGVPADSHQPTHAALDAVQNRARLYGMDETKLTIRLDRATLENAKRYAREHGTSLTRLVVSHLERLGVGTEPDGEAPVTRRLTGVLPAEASLQDYRDHLESRHA